MNRKRKALVISGFLVLAMALAAFSGVTVAANSLNTLDNPEPTTTSSSSSSQPQPSSGALEVTSYEAKVNGVTVSRITEGTTFTITLRIHDPRLTTPSPIEDPAVVHAFGKMNSSSFRPLDGQGLVSARDGGSFGSSGYDYYLDFDVVYNGTGNTFQCDIYYEGNVGNIAPLTSVSLPINSCVETVSSSSSSSDTGSSSQVVRGTGFALKDASYGAASVLAGQRFELQITMLATNGSDSIENVSATLVPEKEFTLASGTSTVYYGTAKPNQEIPLSFDLQAAADAKDGSYKVSLKVQGVSSRTGETVETTVDFSIPIAQPDRLVINNLTLPDYISAGVDDNTGQVTANIINMGQSDLSNVMVDIESDQLYALDGSVYLGALAHSAQSSADLIVMCDEVGTFDGEFVVSYENARGEAHEIREKFTVQVGEPVFSEPISFSDMAPPEEGGIPVWGWLLIGAGAVAAAIVVVVVIVKKRNRARDAALEDEDNADL